MKIFQWVSIIIIFLAIAIISGIIFQIIFLNLGETAIGIKLTPDAVDGFPLKYGYYACWSDNIYNLPAPCGLKSRPSWAPIINNTLILILAIISALFTTRPIFHRLKPSR